MGKKVRGMGSAMDQRFIARLLVLCCICFVSHIMHACLLFCVGNGPLKKQQQETACARSFFALPRDKPTIVFRCLLVLFVTALLFA